MSPVRDRLQNRASNRLEVDDIGHPLARGLGWASLAVGLIEVTAPRRVERMLGIDHRRTHRRLLAALGARELLHGAGILGAQDSQRGLTAGLWMRVAGDVLDAVMIGIAASRTRRPARLAITATVVGAIAVADVVAAVRLTGSAARRRRAAGAARARFVRGSRRPTPA